jgi:hypothetical protein
MMAFTRVSSFSKYRPTLDKKQISGFPSHVRIWSVPLAMRETQPRLSKVTDSFKTHRLRLLEA